MKIEDVSLTKDQIDRLYEVFTFLYNEEITHAYFQDGYLYIYYVDHNEGDIGGIYEPNLDLEDYDDQQKVKYILEGEN